MRAFALVSCLGLAACLDTDEPYRMRPAEVTYMVDTISREHREVLDLWRSYLSSRPHELTARPHWSQVEQERWRIFDLGGAIMAGTEDDYIKTRATIFQIAPARPGDSTEYVIRTVLRRPDRMLGERMIVLRVYAMRENGRWVLSNALDRMAAGWRRTTFGPITYVHAPDHRVDTVRARKAVRFMDSLASVFDAPKPQAVTYYLARTPEEVFRINGVELYLPGSRAFALVANHMVFSGVPSIGEFYAHELTHMVLAPVLQEFGTHREVDEALALWLGGGREMEWPEVRRELAAELRRNPSWTLEKLMEERPSTFILRLSATAALLELAHQRGGLPALERVLKTPRDRNSLDVIGSAADALSLTRSELDEGWRKLVLEES